MLSFLPFSTKIFIYAWGIVFRKTPKISKLYPMYGKIDFYSKARIIDKIVCYPFMLSGTVIIIIGTIAFFLENVFNG